MLRCGLLLLNKRSIHKFHHYQQHSSHPAAQFYHANIAHCSNDSSSSSFMKSNTKKKLKKKIQKQSDHDDDGDEKDDEQENQFFDFFQQVNQLRLNGHFHRALSLLESSSWSSLSYLANSPHDSVSDYHFTSQKCENEKWKVKWKLYTTYHRLLTYHQIGIKEHSNSIMEMADELLNMEVELKRVNLLDCDDVFLFLNTSCAFKCQILFLQWGQPQSAIKWLNVLIEGRLNQRLIQNKVFDRSARREHLLSEEVCSTIRKDLVCQLLFRSKIYLSLANVQCAKSDVLRAIGHAQQDSQWLLLLAQCYLQLARIELYYEKEVDSALENVSRVMQLTHDQSIVIPARLLASHCLREKGRVAEAKLMLDSIISMNCNVMDAYILRAICYSEMNDFVSALKDCKSAIYLVPTGEEPETLPLLIQTYMKCLRCTAKFSDLCVLGHTIQLLADSCSHQVSDYLRKTAALMPHYAKFLELDWNGHYNDAFEYFMHYLHPMTFTTCSVSPFPRELLWYDKVRIMVACGMYQEAMSSADQMSDITKDQNWIYAANLLKAQALAYTGNHKSAKTLLLKNMSGGSQNGQPYFLPVLHEFTGAIIMSRNEKKIKSSLKLFQDALDLSSRLSYKDWQIHVLIHMSLVEQSVGMLSAAKEHELRVHSEIPNHPLISSEKTKV